MVPSTHEWTWRTVPWDTGLTVGLAYFFIVSPPRRPIWRDITDETGTMPP